MQNLLQLGVRDAGLPSHSSYGGIVERVAKGRNLDRPFTPDSWWPSPTREQVHRRAQFERNIVRAKLAEAGPRKAKSAGPTVR